MDRKKKDVKEKGDSRHPRRLKPIHALIVEPYLTIATLDNLAEKISQANNSKVFCNKDRLWQRANRVFTWLIRGAAFVAEGSVSALYRAVFQRDPSNCRGVAFGHDCGDDFFPEVRLLHQGFLGGVFALADEVAVELQPGALFI